MLNQITLQGRLTADPERKETNGGVAFVNFTIAVQRDRKGANEERPTDFVDCVAWRGTAEFLGNYFRKGQQVLVKGSLQSENWTDKEGKKRKHWTVNAENVYFCDSPKEAASSDFGNSYGEEEIATPFDGLPY